MIRLAKAVLMSAYYKIEYKVLVRLCGILGHDWEDDSYGGPETGCVAGHCNRCGYSFHTTLY